MTDPRQKNIDRILDANALPAFFFTLGMGALCFFGVITPLAFLALASIVWGTLLALCLPDAVAMQWERLKRERDGD